MHEYKAYKKHKMIVIAIILLCGIAIAIWSEAMYTGSERQMAGIKETVTPQEAEIDVSMTPASIKEIIDATTIVVTTESDKEDHTIKLAGLVKTDTDVDISYLSLLMQRGTKIWLQSDTDNPVDSNGNMQCYVWMAYNISLYDSYDVENYMYNSLLLINGAAKPDDTMQNKTYHKIFTDIWNKYHK